MQKIHMRVCIDVHLNSLMMLMMMIMIIILIISSLFYTIFLVVVVVVIMMIISIHNLSVGLVVKTSSLRATDLLLVPALHVDLGQTIPVKLTMVLKWLPYQAPGVMVLAPRLVGPASLFCEWVRQKV